MTFRRTAAAVTGIGVVLVLLLSCFWLFDSAGTADTDSIRREQREPVDVRPRQNTLQLSVVPDDLSF